MRATTKNFLRVLVVGLMGIAGPGILALVCLKGETYHWSWWGLVVYEIIGLAVTGYDVLNSRKRKLKRASLDELAATVILLWWLAALGVIFELCYERIKKNQTHCTC